MDFEFELDVSLKIFVLNILWNEKHFKSYCSFLQANKQNFCKIPTARSQDNPSKVKKTENTFKLFHDQLLKPGGKYRIYSFIPKP